VESQCLPRHAQAVYGPTAEELQPYINFQHMVRPHIGVKMCCHFLTAGLLASTLRCYHVLEFFLWGGCQELCLHTCGWHCYPSYKDNRRNAKCGERNMGPYLGRTDYRVDAIRATTSSHLRSTKVP